MGKWIVSRYLDCKYEVSSTGEIRNTKTKRILRQFTSNYKRVSVWVNGKVKCVLVHRVVAFAFCSGYKDGFTVNHINCDKLDNNYNNLEWVSMSENMIHARDNGALNTKNRARGSCHKDSKLNELDVKDIITSNKSSIELSVLYGVTTRQINNIKSGKYWKHVYIKYKGDK